MKKTIIILMMLVAMTTVAACGKKESTVESSSEVITETEESEMVNLEGTLEELLEKIYANVDNEMNLGPATPVAMEDPEQVKYMLGLDSADGVVEAITSEPMMSSMAYSLALVKVEDGADVESIMANIHVGVDARKWICVEAEKIVAMNSGDVILMIMTETVLADSIVESFTTVADGNVGEALIRTTIVE